MVLFQLQRQPNWLDIADNDFEIKCMGLSTEFYVYCVLTAQILTVQDDAYVIWSLFLYFIKSSAGQIRSHSTRSSLIKPL